MWIAQEILEPEIIENGGELGTPKFEKVKAQLIGKRLRARPKKPVDEFGMPLDFEEGMDEEESAAAAS